MSPFLSSHSKKGLISYAGVPIFLGLWALLSYSGAVNSLVLPTPDRVFLSISDIGAPLVSHIAATTARIVVGFLAAAITGSAIGIFMQYNRAAFALLDGLVETWRPIPPVALVPFFILIFGFSEIGRLILVVLGTALVIVVTVIEAIDRVPPAIVRFGLVASLSRREMFISIVIPASIPTAKAGFRIGLALAITLVVVSEFLGSQYGLGYLINVSKITLTTPTILLCVFLLGIIGFLLDLALRAVFGYFAKWEYSAREATQ
jgi:taurine transport system permease protein